MRISAIVMASLAAGAAIFAALTGHSLQAAVTGGLAVFNALVALVLDDLIGE